MMYTTLISPAQLQALLTSKQPHRVFDCSFDLMQPLAGRQHYRDAHIPGAVYADLNADLSAPHGAPAASGGRHPLPTREQVAAWLSSVGMDNGMQAVVYDRNGANYCGRLWWMLKWAGHEAVAVLDGGLQAWQQESGATPESGDPPVHFQTNFTLGPAQATLLAAPRLLEQLGRPAQTLVDARAPARFRGEVEPLDPVAGHIPGALNRPFSQNLGPDGRFKSATQLKAEFSTLLAGRDPSSVVHHCGSGVSALPNLIAMEIAGLGRTGLYAGSWSDWCNDSSRPMAQG